MHGLTPLCCERAGNDKGFVCEGTDGRPGARLPLLDDAEAASLLAALTKKSFAALISETLRRFILLMSYACKAPQGPLLAGIAGACQRV